jgi:hypothetical protein
MVGIANQGATCYMNSLLQALYFTGQFRQNVLLMPTAAEDFVPPGQERIGVEESESVDDVGASVVEGNAPDGVDLAVEATGRSALASPLPGDKVRLYAYCLTSAFLNPRWLRVSNSPVPRACSACLVSRLQESESNVALAIQRVFYRLQTSHVAVETTDLTRAFGWTTDDAFRQHDVREFLRVVMDTIEEKMKGTPFEGLIADVFVGSMKSYTKCTHVECVGARLL